MPVGLAGLLVVLWAGAVAWAVMIAAHAGAARGTIVATTVRTALPAAVSVAVGVDLTQLLIDTIAPWHRLAVHVLFATAFAVGLPAFLGVVCWRVELVLERAAAAPHRAEVAPVVARQVGLATSAGVIVGALVAVPLGWQVHPGMGMRMLWPMYLVLAAGAGAGGAVFGLSLGDRRDQRSR